MSDITIEQLDELIEQKKEIYHDDIMKFNAIGIQFLKDEITSAQFKASSGALGVYAQRGGKEFMIRLRILSGVIDLETLKLVNNFTKEYGLPFVHFTTRQAIQLHNLSFDTVIRIMEKSQEHNLFTKGGGGNFPRNISLSPLSGVDKEEAFDVTPYALLINKYFLSRMDTYRLPRKFKVAFSNNSEDTANATIADLGFMAVQMDGKNYFHVYIGGGLGVNANISVPFPDLIRPEEVLYHVEAGLSLFVEEGDFENKGKARMRYIVKRMGQEDFLQCYRKHLNKVKETMTLHFKIEDEAKESKEIESKEIESKEIEAKEIEAKEIESKVVESKEVVSNEIDSVNFPDLITQKQEGLYTIVLHPQGGLLMAEDYNNIVTYLEQVPKASVRLSMEESMYVRNLTQTQAMELLELTKELRKTTKLGRSISCIGVPICQIGIQESQILLTNILSYFDEKGLTEDLLPSLHISGCANSCGRHQVNIIGFQGKKKRIEETTTDVYTLYIGGITSDTDTHLGLMYGDILANEIPMFLYDLALQVKEKQIPFEEYLASYFTEFNVILKQYQV